MLPFLKMVASIAKVTTGFQPAQVHDEEIAES